MRGLNNNLVKVVVLTVIITLVIIGAVVGGYFLYQNYNDEKLGEISNQTMEYIAQVQTQTGDILTWQNDSIRVVNIQEICGERAAA